jgi:hypothetical protein
MKQRPDNLQPSSVGQQLQSNNGHIKLSRRRLFNYLRIHANSLAGPDSTEPANTR